ncbi:MAG TPA: type II secretion system protein GspM [Syntrophales bacterium]|nr:type II secretion system protein GspM [Syntrophales bacterium]HQN76887.1 type II secretion system protein GspM [Syntrophales bacterium]HQQ26894.1 type II secretion system protein GspM [Syntrophales bacterium]
MENWLRRLLKKWPRMSRRETLAVGIGGTLLVLFLVFQGIVFPIMEKRENTERSIRRYEETLREMQGLRKEFEALRAREAVVRKALDARDRGFTLFSYLENVAGRAGIKDRIQYMKPSETMDAQGSGYEESTVEMRVEGVSLEKLAEFLFYLEDGDRLVRVRRISIREGKRESGELAVLVQVVTYRLPGTAS